VHDDHAKIKRLMLVVLAASAIIRGVVAGIIELGNDEAYYWTYALFPDLSHFDHPPMIGWMIQLFTLNLYLDHEFFIRLSAIVFGTVNTWLIYKIATYIKNPRAGLYAAILYTTSFYGFSICGLFILPDAPQSAFWLLTLYFLLKSIPDKTVSRKSRNFLYMAGVTAGLALLSKYHAVFLLTGAFMFILLYNRKWFAARELYITLLIILIFFIPVIWWNIENGFVSFSFHGSRTIAETKGLFHPEFIALEILGQVFYNNPVNFTLILMALMTAWRGGDYIRSDYRNLLLWIGLPLIGAVLLMSLVAPTLPHWSGPAYFGLILITACWLADRPESSEERRLLPASLTVSILTLLVVAGMGIVQVKTGWIPLTRAGIHDPTLNVYGWKQLSRKFEQAVRHDSAYKLIDDHAPIITFRWFPAAHFDYYIGRETGRKVYAIQSLDRIHKYDWINRERGNLHQGSDAWYITLSGDFDLPERYYDTLFTFFQPADTILITRGSEVVKAAFIYRMIGLKKEFNFAPADIR
jgi:4-amino-4-deoxy-L-arabinose transferase-like glycosyltransferase